MCLEMIIITFRKGNVVALTGCHRYQISQNNARRLCKCFFIMTQ